MNSQPEISGTDALSTYGSARVRRRPETGKLYIDYFAGGKRLRKSSGLPDTTANRRKVEAEARRLTAAKLLGMPTAAASATGKDASTPPTFSAFAERWLRECSPQWRASTRRQMQAVVSRYLKPTLGRLGIADIGRERILALRLALHEGDDQKAGLSATTINEVLRVLSAILGEAGRRHGFVNPADDIEPLKRRTAEVEPFMPAQLRAIAAAIDPQYRALVEVWALTGLRTAEILGLCWQHVDLDRGCLRVRQSWTDLGVEALKSEAARRDVKLPACAIEILRHHRPLIIEEESPVFTTPAGTRIERHNFARRVWRPALVNAGIRHRRPYQLRHTFASVPLAAGESPAFVSAQLGHASLAELYETYGRFVPDHLGVDGARFAAAMANEGETP